MHVILFITILFSVSVSAQPSWILVDNFEQTALQGWQKVDSQNETKPHISEPQVTKIINESNNRYLIKKPASDGIIGNRKALSFKALPQPIAVGEIYTIYTRILVQAFPNNHAFGLSNLTSEQIVEQGYNAFEPTLRVTDKFESNGFKNDGSLMVKIDSSDKYRHYASVQNYSKNQPAKPLLENNWYQIWYVVNNAPLSEKGQTYDVYVQGGEFTNQTLVYKGADFRMKREQPLTYFLATCNTGSKKQPYGNGGLAYDDIYMIKGHNLSIPVN